MPREKSRVFKLFCKSSDFERLISQQPLGRLTCGNFCRVAASLLPKIGYSRCMWVTPSARAKYNNRRCQICSHFSNSVITGAISLKLGIQVGTHQAMHSHVLRLGCYCTCARAGGVSRSRERLGRLRSNLVHGWGPVSRVPCKSHFGPRLHVRTCRMPLPDLRNGWADCVQIWHTASDRLEGCFAQARWKYPLALPHVQGSLSRSLVPRPKGVLLVVRCQKRTEKWI